MAFARRPIDVDNIRGGRIRESDLLDFYRLLAGCRSSLHRSKSLSLCRLVIAGVDVVFIAQRVAPSLVGADTDHVVYGVNKDHPIPHLAGESRLADGLDGLLYIMIAEHNVELVARQHIDLVGAGAPGQGQTTLTPMSMHFNHIHAHDANGVEGI